MAIPNPQHVLELRKVLDAPRERVFRALTDLEQIKKWWGPGGFTLPEAQQDLRVGGSYRFAMRSPEGQIHYLKGQYREIQPPEKLVFTWNWDQDGAIAETVVTVNLIARGGQTELVLTHGPFPTQEDLQNHNRGWSSSLERLPAAL
jgi:uncharacterized protein YndB with AHSA1/START domain